MARLIELRWALCAELKDGTGTAGDDESIFVAKHVRPSLPQIMRRRQL